MRIRVILESISSIFNTLIIKNLSIKNIKSVPKITIKRVLKKIFQLKTLQVKTPSNVL